MARTGLQSLFHQKLDRAIFATYFSGAVVPLAVLGGIVHQFALPALAAQGLAVATTVGVAIGAGVLSLASFFALRRLAGSAVAQIDADNHRLEKLLTTARALSSGAHAEEVAKATADCALVLMDANAAYVILHGEKDEEPHCACAAGADAQALLAALEADLVELAEGAVVQGHAAHLSFDRGSESATRRGCAVAVPMRSDTGAIGAFVVLRVGRKAALFGARELDALDTLAALAGVALDNADLQLTQRNFFAHVTDLLVMALDAHVDRRSGHATKVAEFSHRVGRAIGLDEERLRRLHFAALLHDLGMLKVAPEDQRDPTHFKKHSSIGARMLLPIRLWKDAAPIVLHHHENYDGSGYPSGLVGDAIPLESRIIQVVDAFDAMTRDDTHRRGKPLNEALQEIRLGMGTQFDPAVVNAFLDLIQRGELDVTR